MHLQHSYFIFESIKKNEKKYILPQVFILIGVKERKQDPSRKRKMTDSEIIKQISNKNRDVFGILIEKYQQQVFHTCMGFLHQKEDAEEIAQDVFIEVYKSIGKFRKEAKLSTWLYRIAVNKSLNRIRNNKKNKWLRKVENFFGSAKEANLEIEDNSQRSELLVENDEISRVLQSALNALPEKQKTAFVLRKYDDLSYSEISSVMSLSVSSVESLIHRAKVNLQEKLTDFYKKNML